MVQVTRIAKYRTIRKLGEGAFGATYLAEDTVLQTIVALKVLKAHAGGIAALQNEVRHLVRIDHENVVRYLDCNYWSQAGQRLLYVAMEYAKDGPLCEHMPMQCAERAIQFGQQILRGLAACHRSRTIHGDLKPDNIFLSDGRIKLGDFGLALSETRVGARQGTIPYMAPELLGPPNCASRSSDLWAAAVTIYEMTYGTRPFRSQPEILDPEYEPEFPSTPDAPYLQEVIRWALHKDPTARIGSADEFAAALGTCTHCGALYRECSRRQPPYPASALLVSITDTMV